MWTFKIKRPFKHEQCTIVVGFQNVKACLTCTHSTPNTQLCIEKVCVKCLQAGSLAIQVTHLSHLSSSLRVCKLLHSIQKYWIYKPTLLPYRKEAKSWKEEGFFLFAIPPSNRVSPQAICELRGNWLSVVKQREQWPCLEFEDSPTRYPYQTCTQIQHNNNHDT